MAYRSSTRPRSSSFSQLRVFAAAEPKILGWSSTVEAEGHIRENSKETASQY
jgi:hypothetical protein